MDSTETALWRFVTMPLPILPKPTKPRGVDEAQRPRWITYGPLPRPPKRRMPHTARAQAGIMESTEVT